MIYHSKLQILVAFVILIRIITSFKYSYFFQKPAHWIPLRLAGRHGQIFTRASCIIITLGVFHDVVTLLSLLNTSAVLAEETACHK